MKKIVTLNLILFLLSLAASSQQYRFDRVRPHSRVILRYRNFQLISPDQYRLRTEYYRLKLARERILKDRVVTPTEKRKVKRIKQLRHHRRFIRARHYRLI